MFVALRTICGHCEGRGVRSCSLSLSLSMKRGEAEYVVPRCDSLARRGDGIVTTPGEEAEKLCGTSCSILYMILSFPSSPPVM